MEGDKIKRRKVYSLVEPSYSSFEKHVRQKPEQFTSSPAPFNKPTPLRPEFDRSFSARKLVPQEVNKPTPTPLRPLPDEVDKSLSARKLVPQEVNKPTPLRPLPVDKPTPLRPLPDEVDRSFSFSKLVPQEVNKPTPLRPLSVDKPTPLRPLPDEVDRSFSARRLVPDEVNKLTPLRPLPDEVDRSFSARKRAPQEVNKPTPLRPIPEVNRSAFIRKLHRLVPNELDRRPVSLDTNGPAHSVAVSKKKRRNVKLIELFFENEESASEEKDFNEDNSYGERDSDLEDTLRKKKKTNRQDELTAQKKKKNIIKTTALDTSPKSSVNIQKSLELKSKELPHKPHLKISKPFSCKVCKKPFCIKENSKMHVYTHMSWEELEETKIYHQQCSLCQVIFFNQKNYENNVLYCRTNKQLYYKHSCTQCEKKFGFKSSLERHVLFVHSTAEELKIIKESLYKHECDICHKKCSSRTHLEAHKLSHSDTKTFKCFKCFKKFKSISGLVYHLGIHSGRTFNCEQCDRKYTSKPSLKHHELTRHLKPKWECYFCGKSFPTSFSLLSKHMNIVHLNEEVYNCSKCNKQYSSKGHLARHLNRGRSSWKCYFCGKSFPTSFALLRRHMNVAHLNEEVYNCSKCNEQYSSKGHLARHVNRGRCSAQQ